MNDQVVRGIIWVEEINRHILDFPGTMHFPVYLGKHEIHERQRPRRRQSPLFVKFGKKRYSVRLIDRWSDLMTEGMQHYHIISQP